MLWSWMARCFADLPGCQGTIFQEVWVRKQLKFKGLIADGIDKYSARLVAATLRRRERLLIVLPDFQIHRSAFLFGTALIPYYRQYFADSRRYSNSPNELQTIYFGSTVGIREQLKNVTVGDGDLNLSAFFQQEHLSRHNKTVKITRKHLKDDNLLLPKVVTIYGPVDPIAVMEQYQPQWIAIDCTEANRITWVIPLLRYALEKNLPVIAWTQNPLSDCVTHFSQYGEVFKWPVQAYIPASIQKSSLSDLETGDRKKIQLVIHLPKNHQRLVQSIFEQENQTQIQPVMMESPEVQSLATSFREVNHLLFRYSKNASGSRLAKDALKIHYSYLRSLESLFVPLELYETEALRFWGVKSCGQLQSECAHFRHACIHHYPEMAAGLEEVTVWLDGIFEDLKNSGSPLWRALCNLAIQEPPTGETRLITFTSRTQKKIFLFALLALYNITEEDLHELNIGVFNLDELRQLHADRSPNLLTIDKTLRWHPLLVGLPSPWIAPKLLPILRQETVDILLYPHQISALARQVAEWGDRLNPDLASNTAVLSRFSGLRVPQELPSIPSRLHLTEILGFHVDTGQRIADFARPIWQPEDPVSEVARLLQSDDELVEEDSIAIDSSSVGTAIDKKQQSWCESAIEVHFDQGWHACFTTDDRIDVILMASRGQQSCPRYVRSLRRGDRVVAIPGQRRQNLHDLILSRVHNYPAFELHLALIRRWQDDLAVAYQNWCQRHPGKPNLAALLQQMKQLGSNLTSSVTLGQWLSGKTLCPNDPEDLRRLAELLEMNFVRSQYHKIDKAAKRLRGLHRGLSRRLNNWLKMQIAGNIGSNDLDLLDSELGITFSDLSNSLLILRVTSVQEITGLFLRESLGKFERDISI